MQELCCSSPIQTGEADGGQGQEEITSKCDWRCGSGSEILRSKKKGENLWHKGGNQASMC